MVLNFFKLFGGIVVITREKDVYYCGERPDVIANAKPKLNQRNLELHYTWMKERMSIWFKKDVLKMPAPWTDDPVLIKHKFTNVRREHDRQSKYFIEHIANSDKYDARAKTILAIMFRMLNVNTFFVMAESHNISIIDYLINTPLEKIRIDQTDWANRYKINTWFTNAFNTGGLKKSFPFPEIDGAFGKTSVQFADGTQGHLPIGQVGIELKKGTIAAPEGFEPDMLMRIVRRMRHIYGQEDPTLPFNRLVEQFKNPTNQMEVVETISEIKGLKTFLAYQIFVDLTYCPEFPFSENEFTVAGPGCRGGLDLVFEDYDGMTHEEALFWLRDNADTVYGQFGYDPKELWYGLPVEEQCFNVMSLENCFCETLKYIRCVEAINNGEVSRTRVNYNGGVKTTNKATKSTKSSGKRLW